MSPPAHPKKTGSNPAAWLSEGRLKLSLLLRHEAERKSRQKDARSIIYSRADQRAILAAFPAIRTPDRELIEEASVDYLRCLLAKSIEETSHRMTPKYRNESARRQFFKKLAALSEWVQLSQSHRTIGEFSSGSAEDEVTQEVSIEFQAFLDAKADFGNEHATRLSAARSEFRSAMRQLEAITGMRLHDSERLKRLPDVDSFFPPGIYEDETSWRWGSQWDPETEILTINPPVLFLDVLRKGVIAREAAVLLAPKILDTMPDGSPRALCEQSEYLAYKLFDRKNDREFWAEARHGLRKKTRFRAHELIDFFQYYEMLVGETLYRDLWSRLLEFKNAQLTLSDYQIIFNSLAARPTNPRFTKGELELIRLLSRKPDVRTGEVARLLHVSIPTAMKAVRDLTTKAGLRYTIIVDMKKLGLDENLLLINSTKQQEVLRILTRLPFCRQVFRTYGSFDLFTVIDVPREQPEFIQDFLEQLTARGLIVSHRRLNLVRDLQSVNFSHYDAGHWDIHWDSWGIKLRESLAHPEGAPSYSEPDGEQRSFDKLDLNILFNLMMDCRMPFAALGRTLGVSGAYIGKKVEKMSRDHLFRYAVWPLKIGAEDWGLVGLSCKNTVASTLVQYLSELPAWRGGLVSGDFNGLLSVVWAPDGELRQFFKAVDDRVARGGHGQLVCMNSIGEWVVARWLPVSPDDPWQLCTEDGRWIFDSDRYLALVK